MRYAIQETFKTIGRAGCYFLCLVIVAGKILGVDVDIIKMFYTSVDAGLIFFDEKDPLNKRNCEVQNSKLIMEILTGKKIQYEKCTEPFGYVKNHSDYVIEEWELNGKHFVLPEYDPLGSSNTKKNGKLVSLRIFRVVA